MNHPIIVRTSEVENSITVQGERLEKLLDKPKPIMWKHGEKYLWIPIEVVVEAVRNHKRTKVNIYPMPVELVFSVRDTMDIPVEAGEVIDKYNGHEE